MTSIEERMKLIRPYGDDRTHRREELEMTRQYRRISFHRAMRAAFMLVFTSTLTAVFPFRLAAQSVSQAKDFRWNGTLEQGKTLEVRGVNGSIRAVPSTSGSIQVEARIHDPALVHVDVVPSENGITICSVVSIPSGNESECQPGHRTAGAHGVEDRVDFVVQVPAGVRLSASMIHGEIAINSLRSDLNAAAIDGNITLNVSPEHGADFYGNTVSGVIDSDFPIYDNASPPPGDRPVDVHRPRIVRTRIGQGGPALNASTVSGAIRLRTVAD